ncbi:retinol dehydrogenase 13-like isoform X3 [Daphnia pulicaria]|uniref:retinol dehydrogenase 13-like isoform X3 n=1 Tax=Daphnia pulicaria TaxID=35523 RepID=UPI001EEC68BC|nr:retinol dehydrogenase 13-like isoform X3 [Daphnia pulicaria]
MLNSVCSLSMITQIGLLILVVLGVIKAYLILTTGVCTSTKKLTGKTVIITGANTGIGKETALDLAKRGARVILACRDPKKAAIAKEDIIRESRNKNVFIRQLDLTSLKSVRKFAADILKSELRLDVLINNAGCATIEKKLTEDGLEVQMQSNHFGHFLLTNLLLGLLKKSAPSRIIFVSSMAHSQTKTLDLNNLNSELSYNTGTVYFYSKLCQVLCTRHLAPLVIKSGVTVNCLHPGAVKTEIFRNAPTWFQMVAAVCIPLFFKVKTLLSMLFIRVSFKLNLVVSFLMRL